MFNKLEKYQINGNIVGSVSGFQVDNSDPENVVILETANIDGSNTIGGVWWIDRILSDRFTGEKQVLHAMSNNTIEWGNIELDKHVFLVDDADGLKIKVGGTEGTIWNTFNLTNVSQLNNDAGYLQANDLDGFIYDVQYNSAAHTITFYLQNEPNIVIDLAVEQLITGVELVGNDLVFTFEDSSTVTVPLNTLLVGVVKSVNGLTPNSQGEIILNVTDIPGLSSALGNYLPLSGGTMNDNAVINWLSNGRLTIAGANRLVMNLTNTFLSATTGGAIYFRPNGHGSVLGQVTIDSSGQINTPNSNSSQWNHEVWGLGTNAVLNSVNWDLITETAFYYNSGTATIGAPVAAGSLSMWHINQNISSATQLCIRTGSNQMWFRRKTGGVWQPWVELYHTGNFNPAQYVLQSSLNTQLANYVPINGVTTINNTKTFTSSPVVPNATLNSHAVNLGQLNSALDGNYLPLAGGTMDDGSVINWNIGTSAVIQLGGNNRIRVTFPNTFISSSVSGTTDGIYLRPRGDINATGQVRINGNGQITTHSHGDSSQWHEAYQATQNLSSNYVPINGVTTINNTKTFTSSPVVPNGTLAGHAVNLGQLNSALDGNYEQDILFSTDFNTADVVTLNNPTIFYFTSLVDQLDFQVGSMRKGDELVVHNSNEFAVMININKIRQDGIIGTELSIQPQTTTSFILAYMGGNPYFAVKHRTDIY